MHNICNYTLYYTFIKYVLYIHPHISRAPQLMVLEKKILTSESNFAQTRGTSVGYVTMATHKICIVPHG